MQNTAIRLANRPARETETHNFTIAQEPIPPLHEGEIGVAIEYISICECSVRTGSICTSTMSVALCLRPCWTLSR